MDEIPPNLVEVPIASRVLGITVEQSLSLCLVLGIEPVLYGEEVFLDRDALDVLNKRLYPIFHAADAQAA